MVRIRRARRETTRATRATLTTAATRNADYNADPGDEGYEDDKDEEDDGSYCDSYTCYCDDDEDGDCDRDDFFFYIPWTKVRWVKRRKRREEKGKMNSPCRDTRRPVGQRAENLHVRSAHRRHGRSRSVQCLAIINNHRHNHKHNHRHNHRQ